MSFSHLKQKYKVLNFTALHVELLHFISIIFVLLVHIVLSGQNGQSDLALTSSSLLIQAKENMFFSPAYLLISYPLLLMLNDTSLFSF